MNSSDGINSSRRSFLKRASAVSLAGAAAPWALNLAAMAEASAASASDYKALVCVFLQGGNDYANTLVPYDAMSHAVYEQARRSISLSRESVAPTALTPAAEPLDANGAVHQYALAPGLAPLLPIFNAGKLGILLNVGPLIHPTTKAQWRQHAVQLPPRLFSHVDQEALWLSASAQGASAGWGGRLADAFQASNTHAALTCINTGSDTIYLSGNTAAQCQVTSRGMILLDALERPLFGSAAASDTLRTLITESRSNLLENEYNRISERAIGAHAVLNGTLASLPPLTTAFPPGNRLGEQLHTVARMIAAAPALGIKRQVFFVAMGGFDTHDGMRNLHPLLMANLGAALSAFFRATTELGVADQVTAFTASEFGRSLTSNGDGSDHGWGSMHFVMGGAVNGKRYYGTAPILGNDGPDDVGQGRLLPTTSIEQVGATLGSWMGVSDSDLLSMLPNLANFNAGTRKLGFV